MQRSYLQIAKIIARVILSTSLILFFLYDAPFTLLHLRHSSSDKEVVRIVSAVGVVASAIALILLARFQRR